MDGVLILRHDLDDDPHVTRLSSILGRDTDTVISKLRRLWRHADLHSDGGRLPLMTGEALDAIVQVPGFADAVRQVGWLDIEDGELVVPRYEEWIGPEALRRVLASAVKRRPAVTSWPGFDDFWAWYPKKHAKREAQKAWAALKPSGELLAKIMAGLNRAMWSDQWAAGYVPNAASWLRGWRWEDEHGRSEGRVGQGGAGRLAAPAGKYDHLSGEGKVQAPGAGEGAAAPLFPEPGP